MHSELVVERRPRVMHSGEAELFAVWVVREFELDRLAAVRDIKLLPQHNIRVLWPHGCFTALADIDWARSCTRRHHNSALMLQGTRHRIIICSPIRPSVLLVMVTTTVFVPRRGRWRAAHGIFGWTAAKLHERKVRQLGDVPLPKATIAGTQPIHRYNAAGVGCIQLIGGGNGRDVVSHKVLEEIVVPDPVHKTVGRGSSHRANEQHDEKQRQATSRCKGRRSTRTPAHTKAAIYSEMGYKEYKEKRLPAEADFLQLSGKACICSLEITSTHSWATLAVPACP